MIIDSHSHVGDYGGVWSRKMVDSLMPQFSKRRTWMDPSRTWRPEDFHVDPTRYVEHMDKVGIDKAVVYGLAITHLECSTTAEFVADVVAQHPTRFIGFHVVDPQKSWCGCASAPRRSASMTYGSMTTTS